MRKRQRKKNEKKYIPVFVDEFNLITMTEEERQKALDNYQRFRQRFAFRKKYKKIKKSKPTVYYFPVGNSASQLISQLAKRTRKSNTTITQSLDGLFQ